MLLDLKQSRWPRWRCTTMPQEVQGYNCLKAVLHLCALPINYGFFSENMLAASVPTESVPLASTQVCAILEAHSRP